MKFLIEQDVFVKSLQVVGKSLLSRVSLPVLSNVLIRAHDKKVDILATSLETATRVVVLGKVEREGETTVLGRALVEFVSQLAEGEVLVEKLGEEVVVTKGATSARFATIAAEEFPAIPKVEGGSKTSFAAGTILEGIERTAFCAAVDESRPVLTGVLFEVGKGEISLVATDGFRLGCSRIKMDKGDGFSNLKFVVPARALMEIAKIIAEGGVEEEKNVMMEISGNLNQAAFKLGNIEFVTRLIEGAYPQWEKLIPSTFAVSAKVHREDLVRVVKIASIFAREAGSIVKLKIEGDGKRGSIVVSSDGAQIGSSDAKIDAVVSGAGGEIAFNYRYILEALAATNDEDVIFEMNESLNPGRLKSATSEPFFHIIMPVRLQS